MSQALLFGSACAPFVLFSYFLNGIDILQIVTALVLAAGWSAFLTALALAVATQAHSKLGRTVAHFVVLGVLGLGAAGGIGYGWVLAEEGQKLVTNDAFRNLAVGVGHLQLGADLAAARGRVVGPGAPLGGRPRAARGSPTPSSGCWCSPSA